MNNNNTKITKYYIQYLKILTLNTIRTLYNKKKLLRIKCNQEAQINLPKRSDNKI